jgi:hypothetical protein
MAPAASRWRPAGNTPAVTVNVGAGKPSAVNVTDTATPTVTVPNTPDTTVGATMTTPVNCFDAGGKMPFDATISNCTDPLPSAYR